MATDLVAMLMGLGIVGKVILLVLFLASVLSWAVIVERLQTFRGSDRESADFLKAFRSYARLAHVMLYQSQSRGGPLSRVFEEGCLEVPQLWRSTPGANPGPPDKEQLIRVREALERRIAVELSGLERNIFFLATVGATAPLIGFFGTVWGIMKAFLSMGVSRSTNIVTVGPGIAEALLTTVAGLAAAVPALVAYNYFINRVRKADNELHNFASEFMDCLAKGSKL
jgi:biopolymer transport protein TolQ